MAESERAVGSKPDIGALMWRFIRKKLGARLAVRLLLLVTAIYFAAGHLSEIVNPVRDAYREYLHNNPPAPKFDRRMTSIGICIHSPNGTDSELANALVIALHGYNGVTIATMEIATREFEQSLNKVGSSAAKAWLVSTGATAAIYGNRIDTPGGSKYILEWQGQEFDDDINGRTFWRNRRTISLPVLDLHEAVQFISSYIRLRSQSKSGDMRFVADYSLNMDERAEVQNTNKRFLEGANKMQKQLFYKWMFEASMYDSDAYRYFGEKKAPFDLLGAATGNGQWAMGPKSTDEYQNLLATIDFYVAEATRTQWTEDYIAYAAAWADQEPYRFSPQVLRENPDCLLRLAVVRDSINLLRIFSKVGEVNSRDWRKFVPSSDDVYPFEFHRNEFFDLRSLLFSVEFPSTPLEVYLKGSFSKDARIESSIFGKSIASDALIEELNRVILGASIYSPERFQGIQLSKRSSALLVSAKVREDFQCLNRLLLEDAFRDKLESNVAALRRLLDSMHESVVQFCASAEVSSYDKGVYLNREAVLCHRASEIVEGLNLDASFYHEQAYRALKMSLRYLAPYKKRIPEYLANSQVNYAMSVCFSPSMKVDQAALFDGEIAAEAALATAKELRSNSLEKLALQSLALITSQLAVLRRDQRLHEAAVGRLQESWNVAAGGISFRRETALDPVFKNYMRDSRRREFESTMIKYKIDVAQVYESLQEQPRD